MATLRNLDLNLLKIFEAIHVSGSVSGAARTLGMSQPSVSRGLSRLRDHFDDPLFERSGNGVVPTAKGTAMLESVRGALSLIGNTIDDEHSFDPATQPRHFRLFLGDLAEAKIIPALINGLPPGSPVTFEVVAFDELDLSEAFGDGGIDAGTLPFMPDGKDIGYRKLFSDYGTLIARKGHPALAEGFSLDIFSKVFFAALPPHIYRMSRMDEMLKTRGLEWRVAYTTPKMSLIPQVVAQTDLVAFAPRQFAQSAGALHDLDVLPMPEFEGSRQDIYLGYRKSAEADPAVAWLCDRICAIYAPAAPAD